MDNPNSTRDKYILDILEFVCNKKPNAVNIPLIQRDIFPDLSVDDIIGLFKEMHGISGVTVMLNGSRSFLRYQVGLEDYVNGKKRMTKKEKLHRIVEFLSTESKRLNQKCFVSNEIAKAFTPELNIYEVNALGREIIANGGLESYHHKDMGEDTIGVKVILQTHEAYYNEDYLQDDLPIIPQIKQNIVNVNDNKGIITAGETIGEVTQNVNPLPTTDKTKELPFWTKWINWFKDIFVVVSAFFTK